LDKTKLLKFSVVLQWVLLIVLLAIIHPYDTQRMPDQLKEYVVKMTMAPSTPLGYLAMISASLLVFIGIIGSIGVFLMKPWGRRLYTLAVLLTPPIALTMGVRIWGPVESMAYDMLIPMEGFTVALLYFSQASGAFNQKNS